MAETGLRIGIIGEAGHLRHWQARCLEGLMEVPGVELVFFAEPVAAQDGGETSILYRRWLAGRPSATALGLAEAAGPWSGIPRVRLREDPSTTDLEVLQGFHPDLLLQFPSPALAASLLGLPRFGTWRFVHGESLLQADEVPGLQEALADRHHVTASLQRATDDRGKGRVLRSGSFGVNGRSIDEVAEIVLQGCASWPAQVCRAFLAGDAEAVMGAESGPLEPRGLAPTNMEMIRLWWKELAGDRRFRGPSQRGEGEWNFGVLPQPIASLLEEKPSLNVRWLPPPGSGRWRSTPFGCMQDGRLSVLYEKHDRELKTAVIGRLRPKRDNNLKRSRNVLEGQGHLSYPYIVEHEGAVYVVPEDVNSGRVTLYRLNEGQTSLTPLRTLLDEPLLSPTVFPHDGRWWLFGTKAPIENTALHAYHSPRIEGPYSPHLLNPIKTDIRSSRPGGTPFLHGGELWRPAQDHSVAGMVRIAINRVSQLSPDRFAEETMKFLEPLKAPWSKGIRTLSAVGDITLVDGMRHSTGKSTRKPDRKRTVQKSRKSEHDDLNAL